MKYLGIGLTSLTFAFFLSLSTGLLDAGIRAHGDDQAVITALGGTTFGINILVGIIAMIVVAVLSLKRRSDEAGQSNQGIVTLNALLAGRTAVVIAHRLSTVLNADRVLVVSAGSIVEDGSPQELIAAGGEFAAMYTSWEDARQDSGSPSA